MSGLVSSDPLAVLAMNAGMVRAPLSEGAAKGAPQLDAKQRAAVIGEPVPVVFCRRDESAGTGGVLISPAATEARFSNDASNAVTASYHLVLSEGRIGWVQVRDVFQRSCRVGSHSQTYNRRAGTWTPGNFITAQAGYTTPECPYYCGTVGTYSDISTLSFQITIPDGFDQWNRQVHCFIRNGMEVQRLLDNATGSSNNFADLVNWSWVNCARLTSNQTDYESLVAAAQFLDTNKFNCDINITESQNLEDLISKLAPYFLLAETRVAGRRGLRPVLPVNSDGTIQTTPVTWAYEFTEDHILPGQLQINYIPPADRKPFAVRAIWRQQLTDDHGIIRTSEVRFNNEAESGPYEQHDLSQFCTRENHAVKVAAYIRARRKYVTHTATVSCRTIDFPQTLKGGDIVRIKLHRASDIAAPDLWDHLYQINQITKTAAGDVSMELVHFPIDATGRSMVAVSVADAEGTGILLSSNRTGVSCDASPSRVSNTSVPTETFQNGEEADEEVALDEELLEEEEPSTVAEEEIIPPTEQPKEADPEPAPASNSNPYSPANWISFNYGNAYNASVYWTNSNQRLNIEGPCDRSGLSKYILVTTTAAVAGTYSFSWVFTGATAFGPPPLFQILNSKFAFFVTMQDGYNGDPEVYIDPLFVNTETSDTLGASGSMSVSLAAGTVFGFAVLNSYNLETDYISPELKVNILSFPTE